MEHKIVISGEGSAHPKLGVKKKEMSADGLKSLWCALDADDSNESDRSNSLEREILRDSGTSTSPTESDGSARV